MLAPICEGGDQFESQVTKKKYLEETREDFQIYLLDKEEHADTRPEVNSNRFQISLCVKVSIRRKVTSSLAFTRVRAK